MTGSDIKEGHADDWRVPRSNYTGWPGQEEGSRETDGGGWYEEARYGPPSHAGPAVRGIKWYGLSFSFQGRYSKTIYRPEINRRRGSEHPYRWEGHRMSHYLCHCTNERLGSILTCCQTSTTLTFLVYLLSLHSDVLRRLREEVLSRVGPTRCPDAEDMREMKYMRAVINGVCFAKDSCDV